MDKFGWGILLDKFVDVIIAEENRQVSELEEDGEEFQ